MKLTTLLSRSDALHAALSEAVGTIEDAPAGNRATVTLDALMVASQHGQALRHPMAQDLSRNSFQVIDLE
jgi:hypothetical protein